METIEAYSLVADDRRWKQSNSPTQAGAELLSMAAGLGRRLGPDLEEDGGLNAWSGEGDFDCIAHRG